MVYSKWHVRINPSLRDFVRAPTQLGQHCLCECISFLHASMRWQLRSHAQRLQQPHDPISSSNTAATCEAEGERVSYWAMKYLFLDLLWKSHLTRIISDHLGLAMPDHSCHGQQDVPYLPDLQAFHWPLRPKMRPAHRGHTLCT